MISDLTDSWGGEPGLNSTPAAPYRMKAISTWHPAIDTPETAATTNACSAHSFDFKDATLAMAFYSQGTHSRVLNAQFPRQIGYCRVQSACSAGNPSSDPYAATAVFQGSYVCPLFVDSPAASEAGLALAS